MGAYVSPRSAPARPRSNVSRSHATTRSCCASLRTSSTTRRPGTGSCVGGSEDDAAAAASAALAAFASFAARSEAEVDARPVSSRVGLPALLPIARAPCRARAEASADGEDAIGSTESFYFLFIIPNWQTGNATYDVAARLLFLLSARVGDDAYENP